MTNKEKSIEIRKESLPNPLMDGYGMWLAAENVDYILLKMAEWKDEQYAKAFAPILIELDELKRQVKWLLP